ncbi:Hypothetical protein COG3496 [Alloactinosynnema sp. L-07]|nr:Hypothetical protein COG3496 [Alloactinosynnema sp. L-07]
MTVTPAIYRGHLVHIRRHPVTKTFRHRMYVWFVDVDDLPVLPGWARPFARFDPADHFGGPDRPLRTKVDDWLAERGIDLDGGRVRMLTSPRVLGYVFNPLTVYWCHRPDGALACVIAEVCNTYGERHCYLVPPDAVDSADVEKEFYVSPFFEVSGRYRMRLPEPGERLSLTVSLLDQGRTSFTAVLSGDRLPARPRDALRVAITNPLMPQRVSALIRLHGIALRLRGLRVVPRHHHRQKGEDR